MKGITIFYFAGFEKLVIFWYFKKVPRELSNICSSSRRHTYRREESCLDWWRIADLNWLPPEVDEMRLSRLFCAHTHQDLDAVNTSLLFRLMVCLLSLLCSMSKMQSRQYNAHQTRQFRLKTIKGVMKLFLSVVRNFLRNLNQYSRGKWKCGMNCNR